MKKYIAFPIILVFFISHSDILSGYESTEKEENISLQGYRSEAYLTSRQEEIERTQNVNDAYITENQEELARTSNIDDARITSAAKRASY